MRLVRTPATRPTPDVADAIVVCPTESGSSSALARRTHLHTSKLVGVLAEYCMHDVPAPQALAGLIEKDLQIG